MGGGGGGGVGLKETTVREFRVYRVSIRLPKGKNSFFKAPTTVAAHLKMAENGLEAGGGWDGLEISILRTQEFGSVGFGSTAPIQ